MELEAGNYKYAFWGVVALVFIGCFFASGLFGTLHDRIRTFANIIAAGAALAIPIVVFQVTERLRKSEIESAEKDRANTAVIAAHTRTLELMIAVDQRLAQPLSVKGAIDLQKGFPEGNFDYAYINDKENKAVRDAVFSILNEYEAICVGVHQNLLVLPVVWAMRGDALISTFQNYRGFIEAHRIKKGVNGNPDPNPWAECVDLADALQKQKPALDRVTKTLKEQRHLKLPL